MHHKSYTKFKNSNETLHTFVLINIEISNEMKTLPLLDAIERHKTEFIRLLTQKHTIMNEQAKKQQKYNI